MADPDAPPPPGFEWLNDPVTLSISDYVPRIAEAVYPSYPPRKARNKVRLAIRNGKTAKKNPLRLIDAPAPFPEGQVFTEEFFRWAARRWPGRIPWIHPHYARQPIAVGVRSSWRQAQPPPPSPPPPDESAVLRQEIAAQKRVIEDLRRDLAEERQRREALEARDADRKRNCGRRPAARQRTEKNPT